MQMQGLEDGEQPSETGLQMLWHEDLGCCSEKTTPKSFEHLLTSLITRSSAITVVCQNAAIMFQKHR